MGEANQRCIIVGTIPHHTQGNHRSLWRRPICRERSRIDVKYYRKSIAKQQHRWWHELFLWGYLTYDFLSMPPSLSFCRCLAIISGMLLWRCRYLVSYQCLVCGAVSCTISYCSAIDAKRYWHQCRLLHPLAVRFVPNVFGLPLFLVDLAPEFTNSTKSCRRQADRTTLERHRLRQMKKQGPLVWNRARNRQVERHWLVNRTRQKKNSDLWYEETVPATSKTATFTKSYGKQSKSVTFGTKSLWKQANQLQVDWYNIVAWTVKTDLRYEIVPETSKTATQVRNGIRNSNDQWPSVRNRTRNMRNIHIGTQSYQKQSKAATFGTK